MASATPGPSAAAAKALRLKAVRLQREGDLTGAFEAYEGAFALSPDDPDLLRAFADLAGQLGMNEVAVGLWAHVNRLDPTGALTADGYGRALVEAARFAEAVEVLRAALQRHPEEARLWTSLGLALAYAGRAQEALPFYDEAVRLDARSPAAIYNRGLALCDVGRLADAEADFAAACQIARKGAERATIEFSLATVALARGDLARGWSLYERRLSPDWPKSVAFQGAGRRLAPGDALAGRAVLVLAEQGIGDEIMFANALPDLIREIGPGGRLVLAVEARLLDLFRRSFPEVEVCAHATSRAGMRTLRSTREPVSGRIDLWTPLGSLPGRYRQAVSDFPRAAFLKPDPDRIRSWKAWLGDERPAVGITWRSGKSAGERARLAPTLAQWAELLRTPGVRFVNIQYGECAADLERLRQMSGAEIPSPPGLNIKDDFDDLAALCSALDGVVGISNATSVLAGSCGAAVAYVTGPGSWFQLGEAQPPWYARAQICATDDFGDWTPAVTAAAAEINRMVAAKPAR
jgi:tetratricopeptide (TPR) repeat protein